jgi:hypothetical protein
MWLSIYSHLHLWSGYALWYQRFVTWYQSHGLGLGLDYSNSPTIHFFSWDPSSVSRGVSLRLSPDPRVCHGAGLRAARGYAL